MRTAVLVSGTGSILDAIAAADVRVDLVVADRQCAGLEKAVHNGIEALLVKRDTFGPTFKRDEYSKQLANALMRHQIDLLAMAGFGTIVGQPMHDIFPNAIINTHPSLLPSFPGWSAVADALLAGVKVTGCTIHVATLKVDAGPILAQQPVRVLPGDSVESLHERIKAVERVLYPKTIQEIQERGTVL